MEILYIILAFILGAVLTYFIVKSSSVSRKNYDELNQNFSQKEAEFNKILAEISAENKSQKQKIAEQQELNQKQSIENLNYTKSLFYDKLKSIEKLKVYPPTVNYIFIDIKNTGYTARELQELMLKDNILIRNCENYPGLSEYYIRLAIKDEKNNNLLINYLQKIIGD